MTCEDSIRWFFGNQAVRKMLTQGLSVPDALGIFADYIRELRAEVDCTGPVQPERARAMFVQMYAEALRLLKLQPPAVRH